MYFKTKVFECSSSVIVLLSQWVAEFKSVKDNPNIIVAEEVVILQITKISVAASCYCAFKCFFVRLVSVVSQAGSRTPQIIEWMPIISNQ